MPRGGARPGAGRRKGSQSKSSEAVEIRLEAKAAGLSPLEYMLQVMNDVGAERERRDRMAQAAAPYVHARAGEGDKSKKAEKQKAAEEAAGAGKFGMRQAPKLVVDNK